MWIKKLYATFGKLDNKTLELKEGLNIVCGKNESGKSTWSSFIRAMFYGISTREKAKAGYLPDKEKHKPWNGSPMYGKMELIKSGEEISIERTSSPRTGIFAKESAFYTKSGAECETGEALVGAASGVYERSAFIGQAKIGIDGDSDTEKRILSIASSGDESISVGDVRSRLEKKRNAIRSPRGLGSLPVLESERERLEVILNEGTQTEAELLVVAESLKNCEETEKNLARALAIAKAEDNAKKREYIDTAKGDLRQKFETARAYATYPTREHYESFVQKKEEFRNASFEAERCKNAYAQSNQKLMSANERMGQEIAFCGMSAELARAKANEDIELLSAMGKKQISPIAIILIVLAVISAGAAIIVSPWIFAVTAILVVFAVLDFGIKGKTIRNNEAEIAKKYGYASREAIEKALSGYLLAVESAKAAENELYAIDAQRKEADMKTKLRCDDMALFLKNFGIECADMAMGEKSLREMISLRESAFRAYEEAKIRVDAIENSADEEIGNIEYTPDEIPRESASELEIKISEESAKKKTLELRIAALKERISGFNRKDIEQKAEISEREIAKQQLEYDAVLLAMKNIEEADLFLRNRFSPELEARASEIFEELTGGKFEVVRIKNSDFEMEVAEGAASAPHNQLSLSQGTIDELYFSLRIALAELILGGDEAPPVILDDAFVNFDNERMGKALELLLKISEKRQVILFSCHSREAEYFTGNEKVNTVEL